jgi:hypothetical protein
MASEDTKDLNRLWQDQSTEEVRMAVVDIHNRARKMKKKSDWRNLRELAGSALVLVICIALGAREKNVTVLIGAGLLVLGTLYAVYHLYRFGKVRSIPSDLGLKDCLDFHRAELVRQRDLYRTVWWWYLLPFVPGVALILIGRAVEHPDRRWLALGVAVAFIVTGAILGTLNHRIARRVQGRIDDLDRGR